MSQMQVGGRGSPIKPKCLNVNMSQMAQGGGGAENLGIMSQSLPFIFEAIPNAILQPMQKCNELKTAPDAKMQLLQNCP